MVAETISGIPKTVYAANMVGQRNVNRNATCAFLLSFVTSSTNQYIMYANATSNSRRITLYDIMNPTDVTLALKSM